MAALADPERRRQPHHRPHQMQLGQDRDAAHLGKESRAGDGVPPELECGRQTRLQVDQQRQGPEVELREGRMREDFYYRICSDRVHTPSLREQLDDSPEELRSLIDAVARRLVDPEEAESLTDEVASWVEEHLGSDYPWTGNFRELEQCVRNIVIRGSYLPAAAAPRSPERRFLDAVAAGRLDADALLSGYVTLVYSRAGSYQEAARRLGLDRRTVKARLDAEMLGRLAPPRSE